MSLTGGLQSRGARYFFEIFCLFRSERKVTKPGQIPRKKDHLCVRLE